MLLFSMPNSMIAGRNFTSKGYTNIAYISGNYNVIRM